MQTHLNKATAKEAGVLTFSILLVGTFLYGLISGFVPTPGLPNFASVIVNPISALGLYISVFASVVITKLIGPKLGVR